VQLKIQAEQAARTAEMMRNQVLDQQALQLKIQAEQAARTAEMMRSQARAFRSPGSSQPTTFSGLDSAPSQVNAVQMESSSRQTSNSNSSPGVQQTQEVDEGQATLMLRNIPNGYSRVMLLELLNNVGLLGTYDLVYVPWDFNRLAGLGYSFVNFTTSSNAARAKQILQGFSAWKVASQKVCEVVYGGPLQGLNAHIEHYRNTPVMHKSVPECYKPLLFKNGERQPFPAPTKSIRAPRVRRGGIPSL
jgi:hypothetical protein